MTLPKLESVKIAIVGLGYVGLPLAVYLARRFPVAGFDINKERISDLKKGIDRTREVTDEEMRLAKGLSVTSEPADLKSSNFYIVTVPTPIDEARRPDLTALEKASETVGRVISKGDVVVYEFDRLSRRHGRGLRADHRAGLGLEVQARLPRRL